MQKRGLSTVITTLIIILLVLVAVGIVWIVIRNVITGGTKGIGLGKFTTDLEIKNVVVGEGNINVSVKRNPGKGELVGVKFIFYDGTTTETIEKNMSLEELEEKKFVFLSEEFADLNISNLEKVSIAGIFKSESGKESVGNIVDSYEVGEECVPNCIGKPDCGDDGCSPYDETDCGTCGVGENCVSGVCIDSGLILWNKLGSDAEVVNSEIGLDFAIAGAPDYQAAKFENGIRIDANTEVVSIANTPAQYDLVKGTIEMWVKLNYNVVNGVPQDGNSHNFYSWVDETGKFISVYLHSVLGFAWDISFGMSFSWREALSDLDMTAGTLYHIAFVWDNTHATKKRRLYLNGVEIGSNNEFWPDVGVFTGPFYIGTDRGFLTNLSGTIDNIKWYDYAKTDFSDRFNE